jgi:L-methionine (R)-S-oxide reductase
MSESISIQEGASINEKYHSLKASISALLSGESDVIANLANFCAALHQTFQFHWTGFYLVKEDLLVLGPFQGPVACTRIEKGKGVCGTAWLEQKTQVIPNVHLFPGHIACSALSNSEIVIPFKDSDGNIIGVLDIDSEHFDYFNEDHVNGLHECIRLLEAHLWSEKNEH